MTETELNERIAELWENDSEAAHQKQKARCGLRRITNIRKNNLLQTINYGGDAPHQGYIDWWPYEGTPDYSLAATTVPALGYDDDPGMVQLAIMRYGNILRCVPARLRSALTCKRLPAKWNGSGKAPPREPDCFICSIR